MVASAVEATSPVGESARTLEDRAAIVDSLYRFAAGQDEKDETLFASAFVEDAVLDFVQPAQLLGVALAPFEGREAIVASIMPVVRRLVTSHTVTNARVRFIDERRAGMTALVEAMHLPVGDRSRHLMLKNIYRVEARRVGAHEWRMASVLIENLWMHGEATVLFGAH